MASLERPDGDVREVEGDDERDLIPGHQQPGEHHRTDVAAGDPERALAKGEHANQETGQQGNDGTEQRDRVGIRGRDVEQALGGDAERSVDDRGQRDEQEAESTSMVLRSLAVRR
jgi:hypothetical protein